MRAELLPSGAWHVLTDDAEHVYTAPFWVTDPWASLVAAAPHVALAVKLGQAELVIPGCIPGRSV